MSGDIDCVGLVKMVCGDYVVLRKIIMLLRRKSFYDKILLNRGENHEKIS